MRFHQFASAVKPLRCVLEVAEPLVEQAEVIGQVKEAWRHHHRVAIEPDGLIVVAALGGEQGEVMERISPIRGEANGGSEGIRGSVEAARSTSDLLQAGNAECIVGVGPAGGGFGGVRLGAL